MCFLVGGLEVVRDRSINSGISVRRILDCSILYRNDFKVFKVLGSGGREAEISLRISRNRNSFRSDSTFSLTEKSLFSAEFIQLLSMLLLSSRLSSERLAINGVLRSLLNEDIFVSVLPRGEVLFVTASSLDGCSIVLMFFRVSAITFASRV